MARTYATSDDLAGWLGSYPPVNADILLARASLTIDGLLIGAVYDTDVNELPTDQVVIDALRDATCAQVAWWLACQSQMAPSTPAMTGGCQESDPRLTPASIPHEMPGMPSIAPDVYRVLQLAALLPIHPWVCG